MSLNVKGPIVLKRRAFLKLAAMSACLYPVEVSASIRFLTAKQKKTVFLSNLIKGAEDRVTRKEHVHDSQIKDYLTKVRNPDSQHNEDIIFDSNQMKILADVVQRFQRLYKTIGYGNFGLLGYGEAIHFAKKNPVVGQFTELELALLEMVFYRDAADYGFLGDKKIVDLGEVINRSDVSKVPGSGNYLFKGESLAKFEKIKENLGDEVMLTSGIRGIIKQFYLFLNKAYRHDGNLSLASRSLAPPGYSYHATGDFDIGQRGVGSVNFTEQFTTTRVFRRLAKQGYVDYRYLRDNMLGVRYEPWHIKL